MITYSIKTQLEAAQAILAATIYGAQCEVLRHWSVFIPYDMPPLRMAESTVESVERTYEILRQAASEWYLNHRITALEARIEDLENPNGGRLYR